MISYKRQLPFAYLKHSDASFSDMMRYLPHSKKTIWTSSVRLGLLDVFSSLAFGKNDFVLLPAIAPQGLVLPLQRNKIGYHFYHLKDGFDVDLESIKGFLKTGSCKVFIFIHFFGRFNPQIYEVKRLCVENSVYLFEDIVHGLFGLDDQGRRIGIVGDVSFCSLPKFLPVPDGALFFINNDELQITLNEKRSLQWRISIFSHLLALFLNNTAAKCKNRWTYSILNVWSKVNYAVYYQLLCGLRSNHSVSNVTLNILRHINFDRFVSERRKAFSLINERFDLYPMSFMSPGYPILTSNAQQERREWKEKGVETLSYIKGWQYVPKSSEFDFERELQRSHYLLPLDSGVLSCQ